MSTSTEILRLCVLELRGLREDLEKAGLARPRPAPRPQLRLVHVDEGSEGGEQHA
jgi:hypothetical protein